MSLYGDSNVSIEEFRCWISNLKISDSLLDNICIAEETRELVRKLLTTQLEGIKSILDSDNIITDWRDLKGLMSHEFYSAFFQVDNGAIKFANYFECLITPSNIETYKKFFKGFDYLEISSIGIMKDGTIVASIGEKSDLIWEVFYNSFINERLYDFDYVYKNHEQYVSVQLYNAGNLSIEEAYNLVNEILIDVSMKLNLDFKLFKLLPIYKEEGTAKLYEMDFNQNNYDDTPMLYFNNAISISDERLSYLSYYQVLEYYFICAQNNKVLKHFKEFDYNNINHNEVRKVLCNYKKTSSERESLKLVISEAININKLKEWFELNREFSNVYSLDEKNRIDISKTDEKIISAIVNRIYDNRCSIAHAKGNTDDYLILPFENNAEITIELPLIRYIAYEVLQYYAQC